MYPTPPDSPDGPNDTEGEKEGERWRALRRMGRGLRKSKDEMEVRGRREEDHLG